MRITSIVVMLVVPQILAAQDPVWKFYGVEQLKNKEKLLFFYDSSRVVSKPNKELLVHLKSIPFTRIVNHYSMIINHSSTSGPPAQELLNIRKLISSGYVPPFCSIHEVSKEDANQIILQEIYASLDLGTDESYMSWDINFSSNQARCLSTTNKSGTIVLKEDSRWKELPQKSTLHNLAALLIKHS